MVKRNPKNDSFHSKSLILEEKDKKAIRKSMDSTEVNIEEMKISNPMNDLEGLYIQISSANRSNLYNNETIENLRDAATRIGYDGTCMDRGNLPTVQQPSQYDEYNQEYYTLSIWFKHRL